MTAEALALQIGFFAETANSSVIGSVESVNTSDLSLESSEKGVRRGNTSPDIPLRLIHGDTLNSLSETEWDRIIKQKKVFSELKSKNSFKVIFARTTPLQKLLVIRVSLI